MVFLSQDCIKSKISLQGEPTPEYHYIHELVCKHFPFPSFLALRCILQGTDQRHLECWERSQGEPSL